MGITRSVVVPCACGNRFEYPVAHSVSVDRFPQRRQEILDRSFHRVVCPVCTRSFHIDTRFLYIDSGRGFTAVVGQEQEHYRCDAYSQLAANADEASLPGADNLDGMRVMFGLEELREQLVAQDADLDDRLVEMAKVLVVYEHPFLLHEDRLRLHLDSVGVSDLTFRVSFGHSQRAFTIRAPKRLVQGDGAATLKRWDVDVHADRGAFGDSQRWRGMRRLAPRTTALKHLVDLVEALERNDDIDLDGRILAIVLDYAPRGRHLPRWAKRALRVVQRYARRHNRSDIEDRLFELRFDKSLDDEWAYNNDPDDIPTLWDLLEALPDTDVEGNTSIDQIDLMRGSGGFYDNGKIKIGAALLNRPEQFANTVRHEVGHGVHAQRRKEVDQWLLDRFGWRELQPDNRGIDTWVKLMGGWGELSSSLKEDVRQYLREALGPGSQWQQTQVYAPLGHIWNSETFGPGQAARLSKSEWYKSYNQWWRHDGHAFFLNYWYAKLTVISEDTLRLIDAVRLPYAAMSPSEFFAEIYALYFDKDNATRAKLPGDVKEWFRAHVERP